MSQFANTRSAKLTPEQVLQIRELFWQQNYSQPRLARMFHVSGTTVGRITRGETWQNLGGPGYHAQASEPPAEKLLRQAAEDHIVMQTAAPQNEAEIQASLARTLAKLNMSQPSEERKDDLPRQNGDVLPPNAGRPTGASGVPVDPVRLDQPGESGGPTAEADSPNRPAGEGEG